MTQRTPKGNKSKRRREAAAAAKRVNAGSSDRTQDPSYQVDWTDSRAGAHASRGFQFQHTVGALLAAQIADGTLDGVLVPEALDDMTIEAADDTNVQIKSRGHERGRFSAGDAAKHITDAWLAGQQRARPPARLWVVLEGAVDSTEDLRALGPSLRNVLQPDSSLARALSRRVPQHLSQVQLDDLLGQTSVRSASWADIESQTDQHLAGLPNDVEPAGRHLVARSLLIDIANATSDNATRDPAQRTELDRGTILGRIATTQELIDVDGLNEALRSGICSFIDWAAGSTTGDRFYEGESTQPGHVASGLVVVRPDLLDQVIAATNDNKPVLLTGPSGVGKSAVMWTVPQVMRGVTWFRVHRLRTDDDAHLLMRLARAHNASAARPVGFVIDAVGTGQVPAWDALRGRAVSSDGVLLIATARNEDVSQLGSLAGTATIAVRLDQSSAQAIYEGLKRNGATIAPHWRESYEQANGLTLEFTYLLTQGRRLHEVIGDQISKRIEEQRTDELDLLAAVALAHQWGATLAVERVARTLGTQGSALRPAIGRLVHEHLLVEIDGELNGLHPVRSGAITESIHATPPPTLGTTFATVLNTLDDRQLPSFIVAALRHQPALATVTIDVAQADGTTARRLAAFLQGLRLSDSERGMSEWMEILEQEGVKRALWLTVALLGLSGTDMGDITPPTIRSSLEWMALVPVGDHRDQLANVIGVDRLVALLFDAHAKDAAGLLAALHGWGQQLTLPDDASATLLVRDLNDTSLGDLNETIATFQDHDSELGQQLLSILGGEPKMVELIRAEEPWLLEAEVRDSPEGPIGYARVLQVDDELQGEARARCLALARTFIRLVPSIVKPDIEARWPGDREIRIGNYAEAHSGLLRRYDHTETDVAWNTARLAIARALVGVPDSIRLATAAPAIGDLVGWYREVCNRWIRRETPSLRDEALRLEAIRINDAGYAMPPRLGSANVDRHDADKPANAPITDSVSLAMTNTTDLFVRLREEANLRALVMYVSDHVVKHIRDCLDEPWKLIADGEEAVTNLNQLLAISDDLVEVLSAMATDGRHTGVIRRAATKGPSRQALTRAAGMARRLRRSNLDARQSQIAHATSSATPDWDVGVQSDERDGFLRFAVTLEVPSLFAWIEQQERVQDVLQRIGQAMEQFLVLPTRHGKRFDQVGFRIIQTALPAIDVSGWEDLVPDVHDHTLADTVRDGVRALQVLSGIVDLTDERREHPKVVAAAESMNQLLSDSLSALTGQDDDLAADAAHELIRMARRVQSELDGTPGDITFAAAIAAGLSGEPREESALVGLMTICALAWPVDKQQVRDALGW